MEITCKYVADLDEESCEALVLGVFEGAKELGLNDSPALNKHYAEIRASGDFRGKANECVVTYPGAELPARRVLFVGLGKKEKYGLEQVRQAAGTAAKTLARKGVGRAEVALATFAHESLSPAELAQAATEGALLATYRYTQFKEPDPEEPATGLEQLDYLVETETTRSEAEAGATLGRKIAEAVTFTRDLQNHPGNWLTPVRLAELAEEMAGACGLACEVLDREEMEKLGMGALLGVARGSEQPPRFIIMQHNANRKDELETVVLVGKGITFDSGGISLKPGDKMDEMKFDMSGAAAVLGALKAAAELEVPLHVVGLVPTCENLPSGSSMKPGDILRACNGKTIEIINTDAEGRLILADALAYAQRFKPRAVVDLATLTGACVVALGHYASGLMGNDPDLLERIKRAGERTGERVWPLPLWEEYHEDIKSDYADMKNLGGRPGGAITAAALLEKFTDYPWAHLDIAGTAWTDKERPYTPKGGTGVGVRLLTAFLRDWAQAGT